MRVVRGFIVAVVLLSSAGFAQAQAIYATVSATVTDPNGHPLADGQFTVILKDPTGRIITSAKTPNGQIITTTPPPGVLDSAGHFSISLLETNTLTVPVGTAWFFTISPPPLNTQSFILTFQPPWVINYSTPVTGNVDLSTQLSSLASPIQFINLATGQNTLTTNGLTGSGTNGYLAQWNSGTGIGNSSLNFNVTNPGYLTSSQPIAVTPYGAGAGGFLLAAPSTGIISSTYSIPLQCAGFSCTAYNQNNPAFPANWYPLLTAPITASSLSIPVGSTAGVSFPGCAFSDQEYFCYDTITSSTLELSNVNRRGLNNTTAVGHGTASHVVGAIQTIAACATCSQIFAATTFDVAIGTYVSTGSQPGLQVNGLYNLGRTVTNLPIQDNSEMKIGDKIMIGAILGDNSAPCNNAGCINFAVQGTAGTPTSGYTYFHSTTSALELSINGGAESPLCTAANITTLCPSGAGYITSLTTTGTSGAANVAGGVLNIPVYTPPAGGFFAISPTGSQTVTQPTGTGINFTETATGPTTQTLVSPKLNCYGTGYDLGNNGTSAQGWGGCNLYAETLSSAVRGIDQGNSLLLTHNGQGDTAAYYNYLRAFGGLVASSDEGVTNTVLQTAQVGYTKGTLGNGAVGYGAGSGALANSVTYLSTLAVLAETGNIQTITIPYNGTATAGQVVDFVLATSNGNNSYTITNIVPLTLAAGAGPQTFTAGTGFTAFSGAAGQLAGAYTASGANLVSTSIAEYCLAGAPTLGTSTFLYNTSCGGIQSGLALSLTMANPTTGATSLATTGTTCNNGNCLAIAGRAFADGGIVLDQTQVLAGTATLASSGNVLNSTVFNLSSGTYPVSTAWGNIVQSSCTPNGNGQYQTYTSTTCNVTLGTSPVSPGNFVAGTNVCLSGPFQEEAAVTTVGTPSGGVQAVTFSTRYAWDNANGNSNSALMMQGGPCGEAIVDSNHLTDWPIAYALVGAFTSTQIAWSNCVTGICNSGGVNSLHPSSASSTTYTEGLFGLTLSRTSNVVTVAQPGGGQLNVFPFPVGSSIVVTGATPADLNGTFTITANSLDALNPSFSWAQTGTNETATGTFTFSGLPITVTTYPMAFITGSGGSSGSSFTVGTNHVPFALGDVMVGAPTSAYQEAGLNIYVGQSTPVSSSNASQGVMVSDSGPYYLSHAYVAQNGGGFGSGDMFYAQGSYGTYFNFTSRPSYNGTIIYIGGNEPLSSTSKPYYIFQDGHNASSKFGFDPLNSKFTMSGALALSGYISTSDIQLTNSPTTLNMSSEGGMFTSGCTTGTYGFATEDGQYGATKGPGIIYCKAGNFTTLFGGPNVATPLAAASTIGGKQVCLADGTNCPTSENSVTSTTTALSPTATLNTVFLSGNYAFTLPAGAAGATTCLAFVQPATVYTITGPANLVGLFPTTGMSPNKRNVQCFSYSPSLAIWLANSPGVINE